MHLASGIGVLWSYIWRYGHTYLVLLNRSIQAKYILSRLEHSLLLLLLLLLLLSKSLIIAKFFVSPH